MEITLTEKQKVKVLDSQDLFYIMQHILLRENKIGRCIEHFWMIGLNGANRILFVELIALGISNMVSVRPKEAFRLAINKLAESVIMVHNHPSGELKPSGPDKDLTDHFYQAGKFLNVSMLDHMIISDKDYYSFLDSGLLDEIKLSKKWVLPYELEINAKNEGLKEGKIEQIATLKELLREGVLSRVQYEQRLKPLKLQLKELKKKIGK